MRDTMSDWICQAQDGGQGQAYKAELVERLPPNRRPYLNQENPGTSRGGPVPGMCVSSTESKIKACAGLLAVAQALFPPS